MAKSQNGKKSKHIKGFWPLFLVIVVSFVAGATIYAFAYGNMLQDEVNSTSFWTQFVPHKTAQKSPAKTVKKVVSPK